MQTQFTVQTIELKKIILGAKKLSKQAMKSIVKISVLSESLELQFMGITRWIEAETKQFCDVLIPFDILYAVVKTVSQSHLTLKIKDGEVDIGSSRLQRSTIKVQSLFSTKELDLPINPSVIDILLLRTKHSSSRLAELNLLSCIEKEEEILDQKLREAATLLNPYGVKTTEIEELVKGKLKK